MMRLPTLVAPAEQIVAGAYAQNWDPSVKGLTAFPQVLAELDQNLRLTTDLGTAYLGSFFGSSRFRLD